MDEEVGQRVRGECGYCGERAGEEGERWLPLECQSCHQLFHLRCLKVGYIFERDGRV